MKLALAAALLLAPCLAVAQTLPQAKVYRAPDGTVQAAIGTFCVPAADGTGCAGGSGGGGDASAANQATQIAAEQAVQAEIGAIQASPVANTLQGRLEALRILAANPVLASGAATSALQSSIITTLGSPYQAGGALPLPTGAATSALQTTGNTSLATLAGAVSNGNVQTLVTGYRYQLFGAYGGAGQTSSATGTAVGPVAPNSYIFACTGTIGGGTITLQVLGPDGATFQTVSGISFTSLPSSIGVVMPNIVGASGSGSVTAPNARAVLTGATSPSVFCSLS